MSNMIDFDFPDNTQLMDICSPDGAKVIFAANGGYDYEIEAAKKILTVGNIYTVEHTEVHPWYTLVHLYEQPGIAFNSVMFEKAGGDDQC